MSETNHTPSLPWIANQEKISDAGGNLVVFVCGDGVGAEDRANAALIVRAVNAHDALVEALEGLMWRFDGADDDPHSPDKAPDILLARAALAKAKE
jgi:hypothetical protein